jgi:hypothetical protein
LSERRRLVACSDVLGALGVVRFAVLSSVAVCVPALPAGAALKIDADTTAESLTVDVHGRAQVSWTANGTRRTAVVSGSSVRYRGRLKKAASAVRVAPTVPFALLQLRLAPASTERSGTGSCTWRAGMEIPRS